MKKVLGCFVVCSLLTVLAMPAGAQLPGATIGLKVGLNVADLAITVDDQDLDTPTRTGFAVGAAVGIVISPVFTFQPELFFSQKGSKIDVMGDEATLEVNYVEIPVLVKLNVPTPSTVSPAFYIGPVISFEASCDLSDEGVSAGCDLVGLDERKKTDIGILGGAGLDVDLGQVVLTFEGRYNLGLINLLADPSDDTAKSRNVQGLVGVAFKLPR